MLMALVIRLGGDPVVWSKGLGVLFSVGTMLTVFLFAQRVGMLRARADSADEPVTLSAWGALAPLMLALTASFACWSEGGLETALFTFLLTLGIFLYLDEELEERHWPLSGIVLALAAMTRPEGVLVFAALGAHALLRDWITRRKLLPLRRRWVFLGGFLLIYLPYWIWRYDYYGHLFPNTWYLKGRESSWEMGLAYFASFLREVPVWLALVAAAIPFGFRRYRALLLGVTALVVVPYIVHVIRVGGDFMPLHRFFVPLLPLLYLVIQEGAAGLSELVRSVPSSGRSARNPGRWARISVGSAVLGLLCLFAFHNARLDTWYLRSFSVDGIDSIGKLKEFAAQWSAIGRYLERTYPQDTSLVTSAAGAIPYYSRMRTLDALGLNDEYIAHEVPSTLDRPGHRKTAPQSYVDRWDPDLIINHPILSQEQRAPSAEQEQTLQSLGLVMESVRVPNMDPPYWNFVRKNQLRTKESSPDRATQ
jgi:hypothetical protein